MVVFPYQRRGTGLDWIWICFGRKAVTLTHCDLKMVLLSLTLSLGRNCEGRA